MLASLHCFIDMSAHDDQMRVERRGNRLEVLGEVDAHSAPALSVALARMLDEPEVFVDLSGVGFIDSSGLQALLAAAADASNAGSSLVVVRPHDAVKRILEVTGLVHRFQISEDGQPL